MLKSRGSALLTALILVVVAAVIGGTLLRTSAFGKVLTAREADGTQAYYVAESALWKIAGNPHLIPDAVLSGAVVEVSGVFDEHNRSYKVVIEPLPSAGPHMYRMSAYGTTAYSERLAAAEVMIRDIADYLGTSSFHLGGFSASHGDPGVRPFTTSQGNTWLVKHHFNGSDVSVYGGISLGLVAEKDGPVTDKDDGSQKWAHSDQTFNIWGGLPQYRVLLEDIEGFDLYDYLPDWYADEDYGENGVPWLLAKWDELDSQQEWPDLAMHFYGSLWHDLEVWLPDAYVDPDVGSSATKILVGRGVLSGSPTPARVRSHLITRSSSGDGPSPKLDIIGTGALLLQAADNITEVVIKELVLQGDLFLVCEPDATFDIKIEQVECNGHRLVVISERSLGFGGQSLHSYSPYPPQGTQQAFFLGPDSALWAREDLMIMGTLRPDTLTARNDSALDHVSPGGSQPIFSFNASGELIIDDDVADWPRLLLVSQLGSLRYHLLKSAGIVYAGGNVEAFRTRLHGMLLVREPYRLGNASFVGLHQANLSTDEYYRDLLMIMGIPTRVVSVRKITK